MIVPPISERAKSVDDVYLGSYFDPSEAITF